MEQLWALIHYLRDHPLVIVGAALTLVGLRYLLNRKPALARQADERFEHLRQERDGYYQKQRPLR